MTTTRDFRATAAVLVLAALTFLTACSGSGSGGARPSPSGPASGPLPGRDVSSQYLAVPTQAPIAGADGKVPIIGSGTIPVRFDVLSLSVRGESTVLRARLSSSSSKQPSPSALSTGTDSERLTGVSLVAGDQRFHPAAEAIGTARQQGSYPARCACAPMPDDLTHGGVEVSVQYGALPAGVSTVMLEAPGFPAFAVPVTRG